MEKAEQHILYEYDKSTYSNIFKAVGKKLYRVLHFVIKNGIAIRENLS
jgi:hypothetical protein